MTVITSRECDHHARPLMSWPFGNEDDFFLACSCCPHAYNVPSRENLGQSGSKCENYCVDELLKPTHLSGLFTIHNAWYLQSPWLPTLFHILGKSVSSFTWMFSIERNWSMLAMRARLVPVIFRSGLTLPWTTRNASMLFLLEDRCTGLISHVESPICSRWEVRMKCKSRRSESRRNKWSRNKSEVDEQQRETWLKNQEWRMTETWWVKHRLICSQIRNQSICYIVNNY
jgi:hypothetical protein